MALAHLHFKCDQPHTHWYEHILNTEISKTSLHNSKHMFDWYSITHVFWQFLFAMICRPYLSPTTILIVGALYSTYFEYIENTAEGIQKYRRFEIDQSGKTSYRGDTHLNIVGDMIANLLGLTFGIYMWRMPHGGNLFGILFAVLFALIIHLCDPNYFVEFFNFLLK